MANTNLSTPAKVVEYVEVTSAALEKAAQAESTKQAQNKRIAELIPQVVAACIENDRIEELQREKFAAALQDPVKTLELFIKLARHRNAEEQRIGAPVGTVKRANHNPANSVNAPYVGQRTSALRQSDVNLFTKLGLPVPTE